MSEDERHRRMQHLRALIRNHDVFRWVDRFLSAAGAEDRVAVAALH
jgi:trehalose-6-phosphate synthase